MLLTVDVTYLILISYRYSLSFFVFILPELAAQLQQNKNTLYLQVKSSQAAYK